MRHPPIFGIATPPPGITKPSLSRVPTSLSTHAAPALRLARHCAP
ncbi:MAG TPA: hypothetical protein VGC15_24320 [Acetobacteraceae bacterium]